MSEPSERDRESAEWLRDRAGLPVDGNEPWIKAAIEIIATARAEERAGWRAAIYVVTRDRDGRLGAIEIDSDERPIDAVPPGWTLGPRLDDLLARYKWCRENITCFYIGEENIDRNAATPEEFDTLIDAARAQERAAPEPPHD